MTPVALMTKRMRGEIEVLALSESQALRIEKEQYHTYE